MKLVSEKTAETKAVTLFSNFFSPSLVDVPKLPLILPSSLVYSQTNG